MHRKLLVVGGGKMGEALLAGLIARGWARRRRLAVSRARPGPAREPVGCPPRAGGARGGGPDAVAGAEAAAALLAVKPEAAEAACRTLGADGVTRVLSVVAGLPAARLEAALGDGSVVVRAMPNTPALDRGGRGRHLGGEQRHRRRPRLGRGHARARWARGPPARAPARRRDRAVGVGAGLRLLGGRGPDRGGGAGGAARGRSRAPWRWRPCWARPACWPRPGSRPRPCGRR